MTKIVCTLFIAAGLLTCQSALAADYCVAPATCANPKASLQDALSAAGASTNADRIFLGAGAYTAPTTAGYAYQAPNAPVELIGAGVGQTIVTAPPAATSVLVLTGSGANAVHDLTVAFPASVPIGSTALDTDGTARRIAVIDGGAQVQGRKGVLLRNGGTLEDSTVTIGDSQTTSGVVFMQGGGTVRDSTVSATTAIESYYGGLVERSRLTARDRGVFACGAVTTLRSSLITITSTSGDGVLGQAIFAGTNVTVDADGLTLVGPPSASSTGVFAFTTVAANVDVALRDSVIRGFGPPLDADGNASGAAVLTAAYSDYDSSKNTTGLPTSTINESHITFSADPGFVDAAGGDFRLRAGSPLIDAGDLLAQPGVDLVGNPLIDDGDGDGIARRDIGAFEFVAAPPVPAEAPADPAPAPAPVPAPAAADKSAPLISGFSSSSKTFAVGRARTAVSALARGTKLRYSLSEAAKVTISIKRAGAKRAAGKLVRSGKPGANTIRFSGRIGARALRPGRYRAVITAVDAAGNRSAAHTAAFRIVA